MLSFINYTLTEEEKKKNNINWTKYWDYLARKRSLNINQRSEVLFNNLKTMLNDFDYVSSVIDIGCGVGDYSVLFSMNNINTLAIDLSSESLKTLKMKEEKINNNNKINALNISIDDFNTNQKYDLVFASMCPGINKEEMILKMESLSNRYCAMVVVKSVNGVFKRRELISNILNDRKPIGMMPNTNKLEDYLASRNPIKRTVNVTDINKRSISEAINDYIEYFKIWNVDDENSREIIKNFIATNSSNEAYVETTNMDYDIIVWEKR